MIRSLALAARACVRRAATSLTPSTRASTTPSPPTPTRDQGGAATTTEFGDAVLASLEHRLTTEEKTWATTPS